MLVYTTVDSGVTITYPVDATDTAVYTVMLLQWVVRLVN